MPKTEDWNLKHFSLSQYTSYLKCPKSYELERVTQAPANGAWWFIGGRVVHTVTETWDRSLLPGGAPVTVALDALVQSELDTAIEMELEAKPHTTKDMWFAAGPPNAKQGEAWWRENAPLMVERYAQWRQDTKYEIARFAGRPAIELDLSTRIAAAEIDDLGAPDRVFKYPSGDLVVADLKTGSLAPKTPLQLGKYAAELEKLGYERPKYGTYVMLRTGKATPPVPLDKYTPEYVDAVQAEVVGCIRLKAFPPNEGDHCRTCVVKDACYAVGGHLSAFYDRLDPNYQEVA